MNVRLLIDMNLSAEWIGEFARHGWIAVHLSAVGPPDAADSTIAEWARTNGYVAFTHDLDFGAMLALTNAVGPSVLQVRGPLVLPEDMGPTVVAALHQFGAALAAGALVVVEPSQSRARVLPFHQ